MVAGRLRPAGADEYGGKLCPHQPDANRTDGSPAISIPRSTRYTKLGTVLLLTCSVFWVFCHRSRSGWSADAAATWCIAAKMRLRHAKKYEPTRCAVMRGAPSSRQLADMSFGHATEAESNDGDRARYE